jgi:hypothetical protein
MGKYDTSLLPSAQDDSYRARYADVFRVYMRGFLDRPDTDRGPIISLSWAVFFLILAVLNSKSMIPYQTFVACAAASGESRR